MVEPPASGSPLTFTEMREACLRAGLMPQKIPERLEVLAELPRKPTMKVLKTALVERYSPPPSARVGPGPSQTGSTS